jgi:hypothetical protein
MAVIWRNKKVKQQPARRFMINYQTTRELDAARAKYRRQIIPGPALAVMDEETSRLAASNFTTRALEAGDRAPDFMLPNAHGKLVRFESLLRNGPAVVIFYRGGWCQN